MNQYDQFTGVLREAGHIQYQENFPLSTCSTFRIGGPADIAIFPENSSAAMHAIQLCKRWNIPYVFIGNGSNILFDDSGYRGAVIQSKRMKNIHISGTVLQADCGASLTAAASAAQQASLTGMEFAYGIPGSCGGAVYMNAGAYDGQISDILTQSIYYDPESNQINTLCAEQHVFAYRHSVYMDSEKIILSATFTLRQGDAMEIRKKMEEYMTRRIEKQPLEYPSAGSVFKRYPGYYTSKLIEEAGLKGCRIGGAQVSTKHAGFIVNTGNATASDVRALIELIQNKIRQINGIDIECEISFIGEK